MAANVEALVKSADAFGGGMRTGRKWASLATIDAATTILQNVVILGINTRTKSRPMLRFSLEIVRHKAYVPR